MSSMLHLIQNENMKIYRRVGTWVMIGLVVAAVLVAAIFTNMNASDEKGNWRANSENAIQQAEETLNNSEGMPKAFKDSQERSIAINEYRLENDIPPLESDSIWSFMDSSTGVVSLISIFTIIIGAGVIASEYSWGTIKLLLIRPASRTKILASKFIATLLFALFSLVILYISSFIIGGLFLGFNAVDQPYLTYSGGDVAETSMAIHYIVEYALASVNLLMMVTFAFMLSSVFRSSSLAIGLAIFLMFTGSQLTYILSQYDWVKYILFANTDLSVYFDGSPIIESMTLGFSLMTLLVYFIVFLLLSWLLFTKRDVAA
ncbi:ABC transporter permease subunit [Bacillus hwajinpoensis]|uniref:ABC transporter permease subunit n=2 Tax=Guptibacillus hwajinpoensis TaxID=208199 RepID=A0A845EVC8_9BACL|nr:ABC transporter permease [Pseudalkalibacillus hwajinpoensis]MYL61838.1 ABC transporter permease subunit [Pseudalkalibacillus hwajinpoensis]